MDRTCNMQKNGTEQLYNEGQQIKGRKENLEDTYWMELKTLEKHEILFDTNVLEIKACCDK